MQVRVGLGLRPLLRVDVGDLDHRPPPRPPRHAALVGDDREKPRAERRRVTAQLAELPPGLDRGLLDSVLGRAAVGQHDGGQPVGGIEQRLDQLRERILVTLSGARQGLGRLLHHCGRHLAACEMPETGCWLQVVILIPHAWRQIPDSPDYPELALDFVLLRPDYPWRAPGGASTRMAGVRDAESGATRVRASGGCLLRARCLAPEQAAGGQAAARDRKSTRLNSSHVKISYAVF